MPILLIAGWGYTGQAMSLLKEALVGSAVQVTATGELWQTGSSGAASRWSSLSRYAARLCERLVAFDGRVDVVGWSMGGMVALESAQAHPGLIRRLVIISGTARFCAGNDEPAGVPATVIRAMSLGLRRTPDATLTAFYNKAYAPQDVPMADAVARLVGRGVPAEPCPLDCGELVQGLDYLQQTDLRNGLDKLNMPTLVVHGREDRIVPWQAGEWLSRRLVGSRWCCHDGLGHALPIKAAPLLADDIRVFLG